MLRPLTFIVAVILFAVSSQAREFVSGELIVKLKANSSESQSYKFLGKAQLQKNMKLKRSWKRMKMYHFNIRKGQSVDEAIADLQNDPDVAYAEPNFILSKSASEVQNTLSADVVQSMAAAGGLYSTGADIGIDQVIPNLTPSGNKPIVAIIDTGVDITHSVFTQSNSIWVNAGEVPGNGIDDDGNGYIDDVNGWNFINNSGVMLDDDDHGTHVAGTVLSVGLDIFQGTVSESSVKIMPLKFLDSNGLGTTADAIAAIHYAVDNGASVLNNSWGGDSYSLALHEAVTYTYTKGAVFVAAAGNLAGNNDYAPIYPASYDVPNIIAVAATTDSDNLASFSNFGYNTVSVGSPGTVILSTIPGGNFLRMSGTSMASPIVSGIAGIIKAQSPTMLGYQIKTIVEDSSEPVIPLQGKVSSESRVNAFSALTMSGAVTVSSYQPTYSLGGRSLASEEGAAGCGVVSKFVGDKLGGSGGNGSSGGLGFQLLTLLILIGPLVYITYMRTQNSTEQRRKHERFSVESDVKIKIGNKELVGSVSSISLGGVQINTDALLENGGIVKMSISTPDGKEQIQVAGKVVWSQEKESYGLQFSEPNSKALNKISNWVSGLKKSAAQT